MYSTIVQPVGLQLAKEVAYNRRFQSDAHSKDHGLCSRLLRIHCDMRNGMSNSSSPNQVMNLAPYVWTMNGVLS